MNLSKLIEPFDQQDIEWRIAQSGLTDSKPWAKILAYVTARACQNRLDEVFGPLGWQCDYIPTSFNVLCDAGNAQESAFMCRISVRDDKGDWIHKEDGAGLTDFEAFKGGISGAFKRVCASGFGIGRYLYGLSEVWADCSATRKDGYEYAQGKDKNKQSFVFYWAVPVNALPSWALPASQNAPKPAQPAPQAPKAAPTAPQAPKKEVKGQLHYGVVARVQEPKADADDRHRFWLVEFEDGTKAATYEGDTGILLLAEIGKEIGIEYTVSAKGNKTFVEFHKAKEQ
jgi:hypothetical protein